MFNAGSKIISDFDALGPIYGFNIVSDVNYDEFKKEPWEKNKLKILKLRHQEHCRKNDIQYKGLSNKHLIARIN